MNMVDFNNVLQNNSLVLVDFWAEWCPHCLAIMPQIDELDKNGEGKYKVLKLNVQDAVEVASKYNVRALPTFAIFKNGELTETLNGSTTINDLKKRLGN